eukprot:12785603-Alexandrium_andersonii.AAC.1
MSASAMAVPGSVPAMLQRCPSDGRATPRRCPGESPTIRRWCPSKATAMPQSPPPATTHRCACDTRAMLGWGPIDAAVMSWQWPGVAPA